APNDAFLVDYDNLRSADCLVRCRHALERRWGVLDPDREWEAVSPRVILVRRGQFFLGGHFTPLELARESRNEHHVERRLPPPRVQRCHLGIARAASRARDARELNDRDSSYAEREPTATVEPMVGVYRRRRPADE